MLAGTAEPAGVTWTWADDAANDAQPRDRDVDLAVARQFAARARQEAVRRNRSGDFAGAQLALGSVAKRIRGYAGRDPELRRVAAELEQHGAEFAEPMPEMQRKAHFAISSSMARSRDPKGRAVRDPR